jgi:S1-C subfamily serine protease
MRVFVVLCGALLLPNVAVADPIAGSVTQVGAWRVSAYTRGAAGPFDHCSVYRLQNQGFGVALGYSAQGVWSMAAEAPDWGLTAKEAYTATLEVAGTTYTASGHAFGAQGMTFNVASEIFGQLKSGQQLTVSANQKRYTINLDGIEPAEQRAKECVTQYAAATSSLPPIPPANRGAPTPGPSAAPSSSNALVMAIQTALTRLGYDPGPPNGMVGLKTNMAISAFQKSIGQPGDGNPSEAVRAQLEKAVASRGGGVTAPPATAAVRQEGPQNKTLTSTGTGFFISPDTLVTNNHVVAGCTELKLRKNGGDTSGVRLLATSPSDDLAVLRAPTPGKSFLKPRIGAPIKPAEPVLVFGYPLAQALSSAGNTTLGNVTALSGLRDDSRYIQISAAVQPGNSGGPAVDEAGRLIGVVVSKLNAMAIARATGDIPQNVNFAIKVTTLVNFLEAHNIRYEPADLAATALTVTDRAERTEASSTQIECYK